MIQQIKTLTLAVVVAMSVTGCETVSRFLRPVPNPAKVVLRIPPEGLIQPCKYVKPIAPEAFLALNKDEQVEELGRELREQLYNTSDCDSYEVFKKWRADQLRLGVSLEE